MRVELRGDDHSAAGVCAVGGATDHLTVFFFSSQKWNVSIEANGKTEKTVRQLEPVKIDKAHR